MSERRESAAAVRLARATDRGILRAPPPRAWGAAALEDVPTLRSAGWERACPVWFLAQGGEVVWTWMRRPDVDSAHG